ncbi:hypothetical protein L2E82_24938 [Cichorium intybus]|uniref:Uncharacterized protein n=1 Tax=Cichorium intybus TaxID=13427 RepID=A0ACB9E265_CICIN|nr:hypothetical protein L2E82_24938 [Cichorium intybus]
MSCWQDKILRRTSAVGSATQTTARSVEQSTREERNYHHYTTHCCNIVALAIDVDVAVVVSEVPELGSTAGSASSTNVLPQMVSHPSNGDDNPAE